MVSFLLQTANGSGQMQRTDLRLCDLGAFLCGHAFCADAAEPLFQLVQTERATAKGSQWRTATPALSFDNVGDDLAHNAVMLSVAACRSVVICSAMLSVSSPAARS
ncbi:hypothetical protein XAP6164_510007 [Xanthomonas phaseoli pv. phaseoli]|nr:hypothetical protein XAP6164_510007 [Xanthomonas phaseoli pv. phaseoli]